MPPKPACCLAPGEGNQVFTSFPGGGNLPQVFRWRHPATNDEIIVMNEQEYGTQIVLDRGLNFEHALRFHFNQDNLAPPAPADVKQCWDYAKASYRVRR